MSRKTGNSDIKTLILIVEQWNDPYCQIAFLCRVCGKEMNIKSKKTWATHAKSHSALKEFECTLCDKRFTLKHHLKGHLMNKHQTTL